MINLVKPTRLDWHLPIESGKVQNVDRRTQDFRKQPQRRYALSFV